MDHDLLLITLGILFLAGLLADQIGRLTRLPRVTMLLFLGIIAGQSGLGLLPEATNSWFELVSVVALTMVAFLLGGELTRKNLMRHGKAILTVSLAISIVTVLVVWAGLSAIGVDPGMALLLGAIATATDPAAIADVIRQKGMRNGLTERITGIVAIDDVWGIVIFSACFAFVGQGGGIGHVLASASLDLGGALLLGAAVGVPASFLTGRLKTGEPLQSEAIGIVFLTAGLAIWLEVSFLVSGMTAGALIANLARHHDYTFHEIENIEWPFMLLFFLLAGAALDIGVLAMLGWVSVAFIVLRIVARLIGGEAGALMAGVGGTERHAYGPALLPQAGVAVGMALVAAEELPEWSASIMALTVAATVVFEIAGPPITAVVLDWHQRKTAA